MINVLFVCCAGMSTSLLVEKIKKVAIEKQIELEINAVGEAVLREGIGDIDVMLLGPQVRYLEKSAKKQVEGTKTKCGVVDMLAYGRMDGEKVLKQIMDLHSS